MKVESRRHPDFQRIVLGSDMNPAFATPNRHKLGFGADLSTEAGRDLVRRLVPHVDVILENNATGVIDRLGLGWEVVSALNPGIVMVGTQLYGDRGPWAGRKGYGPSARAVGGLTWLWAHGPDAPRGVMTIHPDHLAGRLVAMGALAGLLARERTGRGCHVDVAQFEAVAALLGDILLAESVTPGAARPVGNTSSRHAPWGLFRCRDDEGSESWLALTVRGDDDWSALLRVADGAVPDRSGWRTQAGRLGDVAGVEAAVSSWLAELDAEAVEAALQAAGVARRPGAARPAAGLPSALPGPRLSRAGGATRLGIVVEGPAFTATRMGVPRCGPAPLPGEHTAQVCRTCSGSPTTRSRAGGRRRDGRAAVGQAKGVQPFRVSDARSLTMTPTEETVSRRSPTTSDRSIWGVR